MASHGLTRKTHRYFYLWVFAFAIVTKTNRYLRVTVTDLERDLPGTDTLTAFLPAPARSASGLDTALGLIPGKGEVWDQQGCTHDEPDDGANLPEGQTEFVALDRARLNGIRADHKNHQAYS